MPDTHAIIMAGGAASRLMPHSAGRPKALFPMGSRILLDFALDFTSGLSSVSVTTNTASREAVKNQLRNLAHVSTWSDRISAGTWPSLLQHSSKILRWNGSDDLVVCSADHVISGLSLTDALNHHQTLGAPVTVIVVPAKSYGVFYRVENSAITAWSAKPRPEMHSSTGIYIFSVGYIQEIIRRFFSPSRGRLVASSVNAAAVQPAVESSLAVAYSAADCYWDDAGTLQRFHANNMRLSGGANVAHYGVTSTDWDIIKRCVVVGTADISPKNPINNSVISVGPGQQLRTTTLYYGRQTSTGLMG